MGSFSRRYVPLVFVLGCGGGQGGESPALMIGLENQVDYDPVLAGGSINPGAFQLRTETSRSPDGHDQFQRFWYAQDAEPDSFALVYEDGRLARGDYFDVDGAIVTVYRFEVDESGRRLEERYESPEGELLGSTRYAYEGGRESARETFGADGSLASRYETGYDDSENVIWSDYIAEGDTSRTAYEYLAFDDEGNWLRRVARNTDDGEVWQLSIRELEYR